MDIQAVVARRYALAFLRVFIDQLTPHDIACCRNIVEFLENNALALLVLKVPSIQTEVKEKLLNDLFEQCSVRATWSLLVALLIKDRRLFLLVRVLNYIQEFYAQWSGIEECTIFSAQQLEDSQLRMIGAFVERKTGKKVIYTTIIDPV